MRQAGYSLGSSLTFLVVFNVGAIVGMVWMARAADRLGSKPVITTTFLVAAVAVALLSVPMPTAVLYALVAIGGAAAPRAPTVIKPDGSHHQPLRRSAEGRVGEEGR